MEDKKNILRDSQPFAYKIVAENKARVFYQDRHIFTAVGKDFQKLLKATQTEDAYQVQLCLAKMTGNFKRGNEKR